VKDRLADMARIGAAEVEVPSYEKLLAQTGDVSDAAVARIEQSPEYQELYEHVRMIRAAEPELVHYAYLLAPGNDPDHPRYIADADVLDFEARLSRGEALPEHESI